MANQQTWTPEKIENLLRANPKAVEKAILAIYDRQTQAEKSAQTTLVHNRIGFSAAHDKRGSYYARWLLSGRSFNHFHANKALNIVLRYTRQLSDIANSKLQRPVAQDVEAEMQRIEALGDRAQTFREEDAKARWKANVERGLCPDGCCSHCDTCGGLEPTDQNEP